MRLVTSGSNRKLSPHPFHQQLRRMRPPPLACLGELDLVADVVKQGAAPYIVMLPECEWYIVCVYRLLPADEGIVAKENNERSSYCIH